MMKRVAFGTLVFMLVLALGLPIDARDRSGVLKASDLIGMKVQGMDGQNLGDIKDLVIDQEDGEIQYAVLDFGGLPELAINILPYHGRHSTWIKTRRKLPWTCTKRI